MASPRAGTAQCDGLCPASCRLESGLPLPRLFPPLVSIRFLQLGPGLLVAWKSAADVKASAGSPRPHAGGSSWSKSPRRGDPCPGSARIACVRGAGLLKDILSYIEFINFSLAAVGESDFVFHNLGIFFPPQFYFFLTL